MPAEYEAFLLAGCEIFPPDFIHRGLFMNVKICEGYFCIMDLKEAINSMLVIVFFLFYLDIFITARLLKLLCYSVTCA